MFRQFILYCFIIIGAVFFLDSRYEDMYGVRVGDVRDVSDEDILGIRIKVTVLKKMSLS